MLKTSIQSSIWLCALLLLYIPIYAQQLKLGDPTTSPIKAALLELNALNQGLLLPRITDSTLAPLNVSPDGMIIYYKPASSLLIRRNGAWSRLADSTAVSNNQWLLSGNPTVDSATKFLGTTIISPINFRTNNLNRMIISSAGNVGIGTTTPTSLLQIKSPTANTSGVRLETLTSAAPVTTGAGGLGVDASGNVVRTAAAPVYYNAAGVVSQNIKIWADSISNTSSGVATANISSAGFTKILSITATGKGGSNNGDSPIPVISGYTLNTITFNVFRGNTGLTILAGWATDTDASHKVYVTVVGY
jgi:hypothetical protein